MFVLIILTNHQWLNDSTRTACRVTKKSSNAFSLKNKNKNKLETIHQEFAI